MFFENLNSKDFYILFERFICKSCVQKIFVYVWPMEGMTQWHSGNSQVADRAPPERLGGRELAVDLTIDDVWWSPFAAVVRQEIIE